MNTWIMCAHKLQLIYFKNVCVQSPFWRRKKKLSHALVVAVSLTHAFVFVILSLSYCSIVSSKHNVLSFAINSETESYISNASWTNMQWSRTVAREIERNKWLTSQFIWWCQYAVYYRIIILGQWIGRYL